MLELGATEASTSANGSWEWAVMASVAETTGKAVPVTEAVPTGVTEAVMYSHDVNDWITIGILSLLFLVGAPVNLSIFFNLTDRFPNLSTKERLKFQIIISDLLILFVYTVSKVPSPLIPFPSLPLHTRPITAQVCWHLSFTWRGGWVLCKLIKYGHELAFQFSSAIVASLGIVLHP